MTTEVYSFLESQGFLVEKEPLTVSDFLRQQGFLALPTKKIILEPSADPYAYRYPENWNSVRKQALALTKNRCSFPGCKADKDLECHHAYYMLKGELRVDNPCIVRQIFPLCQDHHQDKDNPDCAHYKENWIKGKRFEPLQADSRNTVEYHRKLMAGKKEKMRS